MVCRQLLAFGSSARRRRVARRNPTNRAGSGEPQLGKVSKMNEVLRRGYETRVSRERFGGILINISIRDVI